MLKCALDKLVCFSHKVPMTFSRAFSGTSCLYSHYDTLKVNPSANLKEIKQAYFKLSKQYHPDLHPNDPNCHDRFIRLQEAYKILSNAESRKKYDSNMHIRTGYSNVSNQRPYGYPDFTERDEWIKAEQLRRETRFQQEFKNNQTGFYEFNKFYSRPHKLTPEELERFYRYKRFTKNNRLGWIIIGIFSFAVLAEALFVGRKKHERFSTYLNDDIWRQNPKFSYAYEKQKRLNDLKYEEYLRRNRASQDDDEKEL